MSDMANAANQKKDGRTFVTAGISIDPDTLKLAKERASKLRMGWSEYVRRCLEKDMEHDGEMVIRPKDTEPKKR